MDFNDIVKAIGIEPYYRDSHIKVYNKSCTDMSELEDNSIQCVVTSPPYWGLRKYDGNQDLIWGNHNGCEHEWGKVTRNIAGGGFSGKSTLVGFSSPDVKGRQMNGDNQTYYNTCSLCGAWRGSYGLEPTPELYVAHSVEILREVKRVLRKDGVVFWNIGDSYMSGGGASRHQGYTDPKYTEGRAVTFEEPQANKHRTIKPKDLCLIPFRVAIAAQEDGWWIRSVIIWNKPNPMPESVQDRPTDTYEHILMLTKSSRYYWDIEAVREPHESSLLTKRTWVHKYDEYLNTRDDRSTDAGVLNPAGRNLRNVWNFPTQPYPEAHFATFPEKLPETCIKAGSKEGDLILDPFAGSGTTLWVAKKLNRKAIGYELSEKYCQLIVERNRQQVIL